MVYNKNEFNVKKIMYGRAPGVDTVIGNIYFQEVSSVFVPRRNFHREQKGILWLCQIRLNRGIFVVALFLHAISQLTPLNEDCKLLSLN